MLSEEIATLEKRVTRAKMLQKYIEYTERRIEKIQSEISYESDGTTLKIKRTLFPGLVYEKIIPTILEEGSDHLSFAELESQRSEITDSEIISLGNFLIGLLRKRVKKWKAELKKL